MAKKKKVTSKTSKKKPSKVAKKKVAKKKVAKKKVAKKKVAKKKVAKKKVAKKKVAKKKVAKKKVAKKKVAKKKVAKKKVAKKPVTEKRKKIAPPLTVIKEPQVVSPPLQEEIEDDVLLVDDMESSEKVSPEKSAVNQPLEQEYNPDDEQEHNAFGYGWSYNEGLESPEEIESKEEVLDEDAEYARSGKPVGYDLDQDD